MRYQITKYDWNDDTKTTIIGRQRIIEADTLTPAGQSGHIMHFRRGNHTVLITSDWDEIELVEEA